MRIISGFVIQPIGETPPMAFETIATEEILYEVRTWSLIGNAYAATSVLFVSDFKI
jgi:hypothetical protein